MTKSSYMWILLQNSAYLMPWFDVLLKNQK